MSKITLNDVGSLLDATTAVTTINNNSAAMVAAWDNTLSRDGSTPNQMESDLDMNSNDIINAESVSTKNLSINGIKVVGTDLASIASIDDGYIYSNISGSSASPSGNSLDSILDYDIGNTVGSLLARTSSGWNSIAPGPTGQFLKSQGSGSDLTWNAISGGGDVLASNNLSEYTATAATARANIGALSVSQTDLFQGFNYKNNTDNSGILDVYAGFCIDSSQTVIISLDNPIQKYIGNSWSEGTSGGSLDWGSFVPGSYFIHVIYNPTSKKTDILTSFSPAAPLMPSGYTYRRLIGSFYADGSGIWNMVVEPDGTVMLDTRIISVSQQPNGSTTYSRLLNVPLGVKCSVKCQITASGTSPTTWPGGYLIIRDPDVGYTNLDTSLALWYYGLNQTLMFTTDLMTNSSGHVVTGDTNTDPPVISICVIGWKFDRNFYR